eukprot:SAG31_NODE_27_length_32731_cov_1443.130393_4_plen_84_part_00
MRPNCARWLDEIWLPPEAEFGQMTRRPADKVEEFVWLLRGGNDGNGKKREGGRREPEREEVVREEVVVTIYFKSLAPPSLQSL